MLRSLFTAPIRFYQKFLSPHLPRTCRYYPTCSAYAVGAVDTHGVLKGFLLGSWRILRCNPWSLGGVDHVPPKGSWTAPEWVPPDDWVGYNLQKDGDNAKEQIRGNEE